MAFYNDQDYGLGYLGLFTGTLADAFVPWDEMFRSSSGDLGLDNGFFPLLPLDSVW